MNQIQVQSQIRMLVDRQRQYHGKIAIVSVCALVDGISEGCRDKTWWQHYQGLGQGRNNCTTHITRKHFLQQYFVIVWLAFCQSICHFPSTWSAA